MWWSETSNESEQHRGEHQQAHHRWGEKGWFQTSDGEERTQHMKFKGSGSVSESVSVPRLIAVTKSLTKSNIKEERFALTHVLESSLARCSWAVSLLADRENKKGTESEKSKQQITSPKPQ